MAALPGAPSSIADYGLPTAGFSDYLVGIVDPTTDQPAAAFNTSASDLALLTQTPIKAYATIALAGVATPTLVSHNAMWGNAPGVAPVIARTGVGVNTITWAATQLDALSNVRTLNFAIAWGDIDSATFLGFARVVRTGPNVVTVYAFSTAFVAADLTGNVKAFVI